MTEVLNSQTDNLPVILNDEQLKRYLTALTSGDAEGVAALEAQVAIRRQSGAPWFDVQKRVWPRAPVWDHDNRVLLSDADIGPTVEGRAGPFKIEFSKTGKPILFGFVYSVNSPLNVWGLLMFFRRQDIQAFIKNAIDSHLLAVTQPNKEASDARIGGLRPVAIITRTTTQLPDVG